MPRVRLSDPIILNTAIIVIHMVAMAIAILFHKNEIAAAILAMLATFLGATFAFFLSENKENRKNETAKREAVNRALFILIRQHNAVRVIAKELKKYKNPVEQAFALPAHTLPPYGDLVQNLSSLEFLFDSKFTDLPFKLAVEQERFFQATESVRIRNEFYVNQV